LKRVGISDSPSCSGSNRLEPDATELLRHDPRSGMMGFGVTIYWFGGGPGADPSIPRSGYTLTNAYLWGLSKERCRHDADLPGSSTISRLKSF